MSQCCEHLEELILPYLDHKIDLAKLPSNDTLRAHGLRRLFIADDRSKKKIESGETADRLCEYLNGLFPNLDSDPPVYQRNPGYAWTEVFGRMQIRNGGAQW